MSILLVENMNMNRQFAIIQSAYKHDNQAIVR